ncbi:Mce protein [Mycobacterium sp. AT1]|uniref:Mce protein n=1 Tax=Mycobacterium sp. AT1 TaxID=1961706 RepID=UPI001154ABBF|nr:Mce protein [Mycobacterium sp. AT1]
MPTPTAPSSTETPSAEELSDESTPDPTDEPADELTEVDEAASSARSRWRPAPPRLALVIGLTMVVALAALIGFLGFQAYRAQQSADLRELYLQTGRQGAINLTTIDWHHADADVQRILGMATGTFYDDFAQRSQPFVDVVKKVQSVSTGTVTVSGLESATDTDAQVLVAVNVLTTTNEAPDQSSRSWRMRLSIQKVGNDAKVSNVEFVP